jgi:hypothetical protein
VQHAGVGSGGDDAAIGGVLGAVQAKFVQQLGIQVVFTHVFAILNHAGAQLHGADVGPGADLRGTAHGGDLVCVFHHAHFVQDAAQVALLLGAQCPVAHPCAHLAQPAVYATL